MAELVCFRHAPVEVAGLCYGRSEVSVQLDPKEACSEVDAVRYDRVWSSPSLRCAEVARVARLRAFATESGRDHLERILRVQDRLSGRLPIVGLANCALHSEEAPETRSTVVMSGVRRS